jgi:hypothetical protein
MRRLLRNLCIPCSKVYYLQMAIKRPRPKRYFPLAVSVTKVIKEAPDALSTDAVIFHAICIYLPIDMPN